MLTELIDRIDCNPELMMGLGEQLGNLAALLKCQSTILLAPLEIIVSSDDSIVREKAVSALKKV
jgi:hypothetical protein